MRLTAPDGYQAERSYSIASAPRADRGIELAIERLDDGEVSPFFHDVAEVGDAIELRGPIGGHFVWEVEDGGPLLLLGGGSGVVPLMSMLRHRAAHGSRVPMVLLFSARTFDDVIFRDELLALDARATVSISLSRSPVNRQRRADDYRPPGRRRDADRASGEAAGTSQAGVRLRLQSLCRGGSRRHDRRRGRSSLIRTERYGG